MPDFVFQKEGRKIIRLPKCCKIGESITSTGCQTTKQIFYPETGFLEMNSTHINNESLSHECASYEPYVSWLNCKHGKCVLFRFELTMFKNVLFRIPLYPDSDEFLFLQNGSLLYIDGKVLFSQDQYCVEVIEDEQITVPFICLPPSGNPEVIYYIYASGNKIST